MTNLSESINVDKTKDHLANERTFLAWIRTGISIIIFGFVIAKFGITLREFLFVQKDKVSTTNLSLYIGLALIIVGIILNGIAFFQYRINMNRINEGSFKPSWGIIVILAFVTMLFGGALMFYLVWTSQTNIF